MLTCQVRAAACPDLQWFPSFSHDWLKLSTAQAASQARGAKQSCTAAERFPLALSMGAAAHAFCKACAPWSHTAARTEAQRATLEQGLEACTAGGDGSGAAAGAFALMQEAGDVQPVIRWGRAWLEDNGFDRRARDVALTAALAHCDLAGLSPLQPLYSRAAHQCTECCPPGVTTLLLPCMPVLEDGAGMSLGYGRNVELQQTCGVQHTGWKSTARTGCRTLPRC